MDYYDNHQVISRYYGECEALVRQATGASRAVAFDHNLRAKRRKEATERSRSGHAFLRSAQFPFFFHDFSCCSPI